MKLLLGLDVGTTGCKAAIFGESGELHSQGYMGYPVETPSHGLAEQDPELVWQAVCNAVLEAVTKSRGSVEIAAISLSVQGDAIIPVDSSGLPLHNALLGMDCRTRDECLICEEIWGARWLFEHTGMPVHPMNSLTKMMWFARHRPDIYNRASRLVHYEEYILMRLGAQPVVDYSMASRSMAFSLLDREWSDGILSSVGIARQKLAQAVPSGTFAGHLSKEAASKLGLPPGIPLVTGGHDQTCSALGAGIIEPETAVVSTGTAEVISTCFDRPKFDERMMKAHYPCYLHTVPGMYFTISVNHSGGISLQWYRDTVHGGTSYDAMLENLSPDPSPVFFVPHLAGSGTPTSDASSRGAFVGLSLATSTGDLTKAVLEGLTFELADNLDTFRVCNIGINSLRAVGGGARSSFWLQLKADITGLPIYSMEEHETACLGAAILAGIAVGVYASIDEAVHRTVRTFKTYIPNPERHRRFAERREIYKEIYPSLTAVHRRM